MRYIIALLAVNPNIFIQQAQKQCAQISQDYLLSEESLPHITLTQFELDTTGAERDILLEKMWKDITSSSTILPQPRCIGFGFTKKLKGLWNVSLTIARDTALVELHKHIVEIIEKYNLTPVSSAGDLYRPHLTLARIKEPNITGFDDKLFEPGEFVLALGQGDSNGQFLKVIYKSRMRK